ncbi:MAG TPA: sigma-54 dependent transcriptional regulator [Thermoanaerobaculia bacterium]|nr:sigma-54 dependent transcriptional regulator [Thermoanaerobaculia bacterium]
MPAPSFDVLVVDDEPNIRRTLSLQLEGRGHRVRTAGSVEEAKREVAGRRFDLALVDLRLGTGSGLDLLSWLRTEDPALKTVVITAYASIETAVEAMKRGASDYLSKPFGPMELDLAIEKVAELNRLERKVKALEVDLTLAGEGDLEADLESGSPAMQALLRQARQAAASDARILLRGESGTGKGVLARAIHQWSPRRDRPFVVVPAPALPAELLESELFGHARGAFTGATHGNPGRVTLAEGGTLLLDEIADLPLALQPKLLRFIQDREYERVGDPTPRRADVRILAATNRDLEHGVREGRFREDLFYRLNVLSLEIPPLRERRQDIRPLAERLLAFFGRQYHRPGLRLTAEALGLLAGYPWPGNVRELRNAVERATMLAEGQEIGPDLLLPKAGAAGSVPPPAPEPSSGPAAAGADEGASEPAPTASHLQLGDLAPLASVEQEHIRRVLARTGSLREAAAVLGIDQATLWRRRKQHGL